MTDRILEMRGITKTFPGVKALQDVTLEVERGEIHAICGENGAGKSTLMKVLSGVYPHGSYDGDILYEGQHMRFGSIGDSEHRGIVIIHQELALVPYLSVAENIFLGNERRGAGGLIDWNRANSEAAELLERVGLHENPTTPVGLLGVGKQQLIEIAKALSKEVKLLILDEPTAALNDNDSAHLLDLLRQLKAQGITSIMISHKLNEIAAIADRTTVIRDGRTIETMDMRESTATQDRIIRGMVGRDLEHRFPERTPHIGAEVFRVEDWTVCHPTQADRVVVDRASFNVRAGEVVGIAGLMGAGRTELAMSLFGQSYGRDVSGRVFKNGQEIRMRSVSEAIAHGVAYVSEDRKKYGLNLIEDVRRNVTAAGLPKLSRRGFVNGNEEMKVAEEYRTSLNVKTPTVLSLVGKLSGGNQQKVVLSKWLYTDPDVLILDEPTRGIDVGAKYEIYTIINRMVAAGKAVVVISSELPELLGTCDRIYTLAFGRITGVLPAHEATQEKLDGAHDQGKGQCEMTGVANVLRQSGIYIAFVAIVLLATWLTDGVLLDPRNLSNLTQQYSYILILAIGMVLVIIAGHIDLSVGSVVALVGAVSATLVVKHGQPWWVGMIAALLIGALIGAWHGFWVAFVGIPAFITTLAGMLLFRGLAFLVLDNKSLSPFNAPYTTLAAGFQNGLLGGDGYDVFTLIIFGIAVVGYGYMMWRSRIGRLRYQQSVEAIPLFALKFLAIAAVTMAFAWKLANYRGLPNVLILLAVLIIVYGIVTTRTVFGRHVYALGGNLSAAQLSGVKVQWVNFGVMLNMGVLASVAGIVFSSRSNGAQPGAGNMFELDAIAACFIGGASTTGGIGTVAGAMVGGLIMAVMSNAMQILGIDQSWQQVVKGLVLLLAVAFDVYNKRRAGTR